MVGEHWERGVNGERMWVGGAVYMRQERTWDGLSVGGYVDQSQRALVFLGVSSIPAL